MYSIENNKAMSYGIIVADIDHKKKTVKVLNAWSSATMRNIRKTAKDLNYKLLPWNHIPKQMKKWPNRMTPVTDLHI